MSTGSMKFSMSRLGIDLGVVWGVFLFTLAYVTMFFHVGGDVVAMLGNLYVGYAATVVGSVIGFFLGFVNGYVVGVISTFVMKYFKK